MEQWRPLGVKTTACHDPRPEFGSVAPDKGEFMMHVSTVASHVPYLRRFARALTGRQVSGDAYVAATLEAIAAGEQRPATREELFRVFLRIWRSIRVNNQSTLDAINPTMRTVDKRLEALTPLPRIAFLLLSLEGFDVEQIAGILETEPSGVQDLLSEAEIEIASQLHTDVLIIEDDPLIALDLESLVSQLGHAVTRTTQTHADAMAAINEQMPGLILADIQLADGSSGLDAVNEILTVQNLPVVFITAYPERLLTGERPEPTFLITKPFRPETVKAVISQALFFDRRAESATGATGRRAAH
jgi:CheY-like chemotaxis protein/DNA-directed RNA polymerase specialized sigma24 family protein